MYVKFHCACMSHPLLDLEFVHHLHVHSVTSTMKLQIHECNRHSVMVSNLDHLGYDMAGTWSTNTCMLLCTGMPPHSDDACGLDCMLVVMSHVF